MLKQQDNAHLNEQQKRLLINHFAAMINENRKALLQKVLNQRTRYITLVLEDIVNSQNASAVLRTAEGMGLQDVHIIDQANKYVLNKGVLKGAYKWLNIYKHKQSTIEVLHKLKSQGYCLYALDPSPNSKSIFDIELHKGKAALLIGNEHFGLSKDALTLADEQIHIPMYGFTESFNLSVSAAMTLQVLMPALYKSNINWQLLDDEKLDLTLDWYRKSVPRGYVLEQEFLRLNTKL
ncbi:MAG TPA: RNA methyltransferase [Cyclobacteriaceae bacterium]|nr:RNA methyltransferase [Cyclobacteriaceae bacterium]